MRKGYVLGILTAAFGVTTGVAIFNCAPSDDESVDIVTKCDVAKLRAEAPEQTARAYFETANRLQDRSKDVEKRLIDVCNKINTESGAPVGADLRAACSAVANRLNKAQRGKADGGDPTAVWVNIGFAEVCAPNTQAQAACLSQCGTGACDPNTACNDAGTATGKCGATCEGRCVATGEATACMGACRGACLPAPDAGPTDCAGECTGECGAATWTGACAQGCDQNFVGDCLGTCTGICDTTRVGDAGVADAAADADLDAGDADPDAAPEPPPEPPPPGPAPGGSDGNCKGLCIGVCSAKASGTCTAPCRGGFTGGSCAACTGSCSTAGESCLTTCRGSCVTAATAGDAGTCAGDCVGTCSTPMAGATCDTAAVGCAANVLCQNVCAVRAATEATCAAPLDVEVRLAGDDAFYAVIKKHAAELAAVALEAKLMNEESARLNNVRLLDYANIGATRDAVRACVSESAPIVAEARTRLASVVLAASAVRKGTAF